MSHSAHFPNRLWYTALVIVWIIFSETSNFVSCQTSSPIATPTLAPTTLPWLSTPISTSGISYSFSTGAINNDGSCVTLGTSDGSVIFSRQSLTAGAFNEQSVSPITGGNRFSSISMSLSGEYQVALFDGLSILTSNNYGTSWVKNNQGLTTTNANGWTFSAMSDDGYFIFLAQAATSPPTFAFYHGDSTSTWNPSFTVSVPTTGTIGMGIFAIGMDSQGQTLYFVDNVQTLYISHNYGSTWKYQYSTYDFNSLISFSMSRSTGSANAIAVFGSTYYTSANKGNTWYQHNTPNEIYGNTFTSMVISYSGKYVFGMISNTSANVSSMGGLYISSDFGNTWTFSYPYQNNVIPLINPAGNFLAFVGTQATTTPKLYYSQPNGKD